MPKKKREAGAGRPSQLTDELWEKLRIAVINGKTLADFARENAISEDTVHFWSSHNFHGFADKVDVWKRERRLGLAEKNIDKFLQMDITSHEIRRVRSGDDDEETVVERDYVDPQLARVQSDMTKFVAETLGKDKGYAKRNELTGAGGSPLIPVDGEKKKKADQALHGFLGSNNGDTE